MLIVHILCWVAVIALLAVHVLVERGRLPRGGRAFRIAGAGAAASIVLAAVATQFWPIAVLGLLWLRTEVFAHRDPSDTENSHRLAHFAHTAGRITQRALALLLRIEIIVIVVVVLVLLGNWAKQNGAEFNGKSDRVLCSLLRGNC